MFRRGQESQTNAPIPGLPRAAEPARGADTLLSATFRLLGDITVPGGLRLEGSVHGNVRAAGSIYIGAKAVVVGNVQAFDAVIAGRIEGDLRTRQSVDLLKGCRLEGDVCARSFRIEDGAFFQGNYDSRVNDDE